MSRVPRAPLYLGCAPALDRYLAAFLAMLLIPFAPLFFLFTSSFLLSAIRVTFNNSDAARSAPAENPRSPTRPNRDSKRREAMPSSAE